MNKQRRKALQNIYDKLVDLRDELDNIKDEEECYRDNMPENLQSSEKYEKAENACCVLENAFYSIDEALDSIEEAIE